MKLTDEQMDLMEHYMKEIGKCGSLCLAIGLTEVADKLMDATVLFLDGLDPEQRDEDNKGPNYLGIKAIQAKIKAKLQEQTKH